MEIGILSIVSSPVRSAAIFLAAFVSETRVLAQEQRNDGQATFVYGDDLFSFAISAAQNSSTNDIYFSMRAPVSRTWASIGLGYDIMEDSLMLMMYPNAEGDNVTFSPRLCNGHVEPYYWDKLRWEVLDGTGILDGQMVLNGRCIEHCVSWPTGFLDLQNPKQHATFAVGGTAIGVGIACGVIISVRLYLARRWADSVAPSIPLSQSA